MQFRKTSTGSRFDFAGIKVGNCEKWYELVVVDLVPVRNEPDGKAKKLVQYEAHHFILPVEKKKKKDATPTEDINAEQLDEELAAIAKKDVDFTAKCLKMFFKKVLRNTTKKLRIFTDGGAADFKNSKFENFLLGIQVEINELRNEREEIQVEHHVFAPNHGQGIYSAAHSIAVKKMKIWAL